MIREAADSDQTLWNAFVEQQSLAHLYHLYEWRHVLEKSFGLKTFYFLSENENKDVQGVLPLSYQKSVFFGKNMVSLPFLNMAGVLTANADVRNELIQASIQKAETLKATTLELRHDTPSIESLPSRKHKVTFLLDLPDSTEQLWKQLKDKVRNQVRKAEKSGLEFKNLGSGGVDVFYNLYALNMRNLGSPVISKKWYENIAKAFPEKLNIYAVYLKGRPISSGFTLNHKGKMEIPWAASDWKYLKTNENMYLYWNILKDAVDKKLNCFDFGRCSPKAGTYHFKKQWGGTEVPYYWYYWAPKGTPSKVTSGDRPIFEVVKSMWKWLPMTAANCLGPKLSKSLPI